MSLKTRTALGNALKKRMAEKPVDKITINELIHDCDINRQTFYYHFEDIYDLLRWVFEQDAKTLISNNEKGLIWQDSLRELLYYLSQNRAFCKSALNSLGRMHLQTMLSDYLTEILHMTIENIVKELNVPNGRTQAEYINLCTRFCIISLTGLMEDWLTEPSGKTPEEIVTFADDMIQSLIAGIRLRYGKQ